MPKRKVVLWWVYTHNNQRSNHELNRLLIAEQDFSEAQKCPDGTLPMWRIRDRAVLDMFELTAKGNTDYRYTVYEEDQFGTVRRREDGPLRRAS